MIEGSKVVHSFEWVIDREATQTQAGSKHEECKGCGYKNVAVEIPATGVPTPPAVTTQPEATATPTAPAESVVVSSPKTGDDMSLLWIALFLISGLGAAITIIIRKKEQVGKE